MGAKEIIIKGAREHNLKNIDINIPRDKLVVITGLSGSGKSTLAFDTIYAEGQRRYVESLSAYARQFLEMMDKPDVDLIEGLSPAISIEQKTTSKNPRSTVGTVTEIYDYLRLLYARIGVPHCWECGRPISSMTVQQMVDQVLGFPSGTRVHLLAPIVTGRKGEYQKELQHLQREGYARVKIDGQLRGLSDEIQLEKNKKHSIEVVVDRLVIKEGVEKRLTDSMEQAVKLGQGIVMVEELGGPVHLFSEKFACPEHGVSLGEMSPRLFSFNNPFGACETCGGLGVKIRFDPDLVIPDPDLSLKKGAIAPWEKRGSIFFYQMIEALAQHYGFNSDTPFRKLSEKVQGVILHGSGHEEIDFSYERDGRKHYFRKSFEGVLPNLERRYRESERDELDEEFTRFMSSIPCPTCEGARLKKEARFVLIEDMPIHKLTALSVRETVRFVENLKLDARRTEIGRRIIKEIRDRLGFLEKVGLGYLTLDRSSATLSGGESQRIRLATQVGSSLVGVLYILDEPSIGLHQRDNRRLLSTLMDLRDQGNSVLVVEHDPETILNADHVIDMGPGAGRMGGEIVFSGKPADILKSEDSLTGKYLSGREFIPVPKKRRSKGKKKITIRGARANNLKNIEVAIPLGVFNCITGVSGSGKSTLVMDILYRALAQRLYKSKDKAGEIDSIEGMSLVDKVIDIDQSPIGRTPRSNPATYTGVFTFIRELFANLPESKVRGYKPGRYSFNVKGGRCEACRGDGIIKIEMHFLPDVYVKCEVCKGKRYNRETLDIRYKGKNISEVLDMTVNQAAEFMANIPSVFNKLQTIQAVGLGYIKLGQAATTLSGGEAQRIKLSRELSKRSTGRTLYILDEPTTGLHFADVRKLLDVLMSLVDAGNTVVVIEHNMDVIKVADHIIDLGPEGGDEGGTIIAQGTPEQVSATPGSYTGLYLKEVLENDKGYQPFSIDTEQVATVVLSHQNNTTPTRERRKAAKPGVRKSASRLN
ncbi:excinuclease ABC subunit UvrA [Desulfomonile tiedjei]|uniref:UvrABC system protein A n=1 Tax=Desulfomonile tiedjei (strain ATCC 49306 / DSM 6799 / DCB-1) TaxID=706587 RepID=I4C6H1_DESTA|nr:excinuclease ABC subunit UvrA [Desulfomonile tiedjei]AFM25162.1 excinuclease ABC, A subunit [Desulfomonile tiedjei DSM 6799]